jgi:predicted ATPase
MKIDLHCHTRKIKSGDSCNRNVSFDDFVNKTKLANVSIVAITNHNFFDYDQFVKFSKTKNVKVWPGIELDIVGKKGSSHCIVIVNPKDVLDFKKICEEKINNQNPDTFNISIDDLVNSFDCLDAIYIVHYYKSPSIHDSDLEYFKNKLNGKNNLYLEPGNLKSAGIFIAHGLQTLIGSDVSNWSEYEKCEIPELKLPIESFEKFKLLLSKNDNAIKTFLDKKYHEVVSVTPFPDFKLSLEIYNDVNIFFGGKGTGKTETLKKIESYYKSKGNNDVVSYYGADKKKQYSDIIMVNVDDKDVDLIGIEDDDLELNTILNWNDISITSIKDYVEWIKSKKTSSKKNFGFINSTFDTVITAEKHDESIKRFKRINKGFEDIDKNEISKIIDQEDFNIYKTIKSKILNNARKNAIDDLIKYHSLKLEKLTIDKMKNLYFSKKAEKSKPTEAGFVAFFANLSILSNRVKIINQLLDMDYKTRKITIGYLPDKGKIYIQKKVSLNPDLFDKESKFRLGQGNLTTLKELKKLFIKLEDKVFSKDANEIIATIKAKLTDSKINSLIDFLAVKGVTKKEDGNDYNPSSGEQAMLILNNTLLDDSKNVFILDEPELSVGHAYINDVIVPRIKYLASIDKKIIISTHDANIGVRTLPFQTIYRVDLGDNKYQTFIGNPFEDILRDIDDSTKTLNWSTTALKTLEGGKEAFLERDIVYGKEMY